MTSRRLRPIGVLSRYVARQLGRPFLLGSSVVIFLLTLELLLDYLDLILGKGIPILTVLRLFLLGLGWMIALAVPCGVLVAALMVYGQMSQDNEITALRASGVSLATAIVPSFLLACAVSAGLMLFNDRVLPETNHSFANLVTQIQHMRPTAHIQEGIFIDDFEGYNLFIGKLDDRTGKMTDVLIIDASENRGSPRTIRARKGFLESTPSQNAISLHLIDGEVHEADPDVRDGRYRRLAFREQTIRLKGASEALSRAVRRNRGQREMSVAAMRTEILSLQKELKEHQTQVDSSMTRLGITDTHDLPDEEGVGLSPRGPGRLLGLIAGLFERRGPKRGPQAEEEQPARQRNLEELRIHILQLRGTERQIDSFRVEIQKKFSIPIACVVFVLIGAPLGMRARRGGLAAGFLSVAFFLFYWACLIGGEQLADRGLLQPWLAMWFPNLLLGAAGVYYTYRVVVSGLPEPATRRRKR